MQDFPSVNNSINKTFENQNASTEISNLNSNNEAEDDVCNKVSPKKALLWRKAYEHLQKQADMMIKRVHMKGGPVNVGNVVQVSISKVDLVKTDCKNLMLMVVEEWLLKKNPPTYRLANKLFQMNHLCSVGAITVVEDVNPK